ncbi:hypothetical protein Micbo1qcDRAFT_61739 [Microdochium bolleyi]|uniref:rRNA-processing protein FYV7 n=1 Tax=Microdochium bolleyi TaxID=196109 RepID=A0A136J5M5_9PEZI|nr:hypothetical protein Micbo1qcDRAFT_61739 [Microdochium bolleyi]
MAPSKRPRASDDSAAGSSAAKKPRTGFRVGPANLPDGAWKRKVDRIKQDLIHKAKVRKAYKKVRAAELGDKPRRVHSSGKRNDGRDNHKDDDEKVRGGDVSDIEDDEEEEHEHATRSAVAEEPSVEVMKDNDEDQEAENRKRHSSKASKPETESMQENGDVVADKEEDHHDPHQHPERRRRNQQQQRRPGYFDKAKAEAERKQAAAEARNAEFERRNAERAGKIADRERYNRALKKARMPGRDGQRRLGRESGLLLEKAKRLVGNTK